MVWQICRENLCGMSGQNDGGKMINRRKQLVAVDCGSFVHVAFHHSATIILPNTNLVSPVAFAGIH